VIKNILHFEREAIRKGYKHIAGIDEVGRGPLAGPVVAAAVVFKGATCRLPLNDSKLLSSKKREIFASQIHSYPDVDIAIVFLDSLEVDKLNILRATHKAMKLALQKLSRPADFALVDGLKVPNFPIDSEFIVKGDSRSISIAAASIVAKVARDKLMQEYDVQYPGYGFAAHKGYGTKQHLQALQKLGACPIHRYSFAPVRAVINKDKKQQEFNFL